MGVGIATAIEVAGTFKSGAGAVSIDKSDPHACPYCMLPFEIEAVRFGFFEANAVFVCRNCGLSPDDSIRNPSIAKRILADVTRWRSFLERRPPLNTAP
jgi:hypothetical protein